MTTEKKWSWKKEKPTKEKAEPPEWRKTYTKAERRDMRDQTSLLVGVASLGVGVASLALALNGKPDPEGLEISEEVAGVLGITQEEAYMRMCGEEYDELLASVDARTARKLKRWKKTM